MNDNIDRADPMVQDIIEAQKEMKKVCDGCKHEPELGEPYPIVCGECSRWYPDMYEESK